MAAPSVYAAINAVSAELAQNGIPKAHTNASDDYKYRSIDDVLNRLAPLLAQHRICVLPSVLDREIVERHDEMGRSLFHVALKVAFNLTSVDDASNHVVESYGEGLDASDKATAKAMSAAYKSAMVQTFCIPCSNAEDPDRASYRPSAWKHVPEPDQGWQQWVSDIGDILAACESEQAICVLQERNRPLLLALGRERPELYERLGAAVAARKDHFAARHVQTPIARRGRSKCVENAVREPC